MAKPLILLLGAGGHARACVDVIEQQGEFALMGLVGLPHEVGTQVLGYPVLGSDADLPELLANCGNALVALGQIKTAEPRMRSYSGLVRSGCALPSIVSPRAYVSRHAELGAGSIVMHGAVVNAGAVVGANCIVNSLALVEHDAVIEDHCHISTGAAINGGARIGAGSFVGSGARVREGVRVGTGSVIGMGQWVLDDCPVGTWMSARRPA